SESPLEGSFTLSEPSLKFSNTQTNSSLIITNNSEIALEFTLRKKLHTYMDDLGVQNVSDGALAWMSVGEFGHTTQESEVAFLVDGNGGEKRIVFLDAAVEELSQWDGIIEISNPQIGTQRVYLSYSEVPEGKWKGSVHYFANFGDQNLEEWRTQKDTGLSVDAYQTLLGQVGNAFIQKWGVFRQGWIPYEELVGALNATTTGSWNWPSTKAICPWDAGACYLYDNPNGYIEYTSNRYVVPVPSGVSSLPISMNLRQDPNSDDPGLYSGKVLTDDALHYQGDPAVELLFAGDPASPEACSAVSNGVCILHVKEMDMDIWTGGRYWRKSQYEPCPSADYEATETPWMVPGFSPRGPSSDDQSYAWGCRTKTAPYGSTSAGGEDMSDTNINLAGSNPLPNGRVLKRHVEVIDGALVNQENLILIFRERFQTSLGSGSTAEFFSYGVMMLNREADTLEEGDYTGWEVTSPPVFDEDVLNVECSQDMLDKILDGRALTTSTASALARGVIRGEKDGVGAEVIESSDSEDVHYFCEDTGLINGGPDEFDSSYTNNIECPWGSRVQFFTLESQASCTYEDIADLDCQQDGSCQDLLNLWDTNKTCGIRLDPFWTCSEENEVYCDDNRSDLREGKTFYRKTEDQPAFLSLEASTERAFRYKIRFQSRSGSGVGFAPEPCIPDSDIRPYCYDPAEIENLQERVDCALHIFENYYDNMDTSSQDMLRTFLRNNFSRDENEEKDGFERLNAELLIMLGDEAYTSAFASRFDLAGIASHSFEGSLFEPNGMDISGGAGFEMYKLYQAAQYYGLALDRFYSLSPYIWASINRGSTNQGRNFVTEQMVTEYIDRLARASTQYARTLSEIAKHYQHFSRADLAKGVIQRAYSSAYLESVILSHLMLKVIKVSAPSVRDQIRQRIDISQRTYGAALLDMRDIYANLTQDVNQFGYAPDYIPFPALDEEGENAFEKMLAIADQRLMLAQEKESVALATSRSYETDSALFQSELLQIQNNYEDQLAGICGTFAAEDGRIYPAIPKYAHLHPVGKLLGDPCGLVRTGELHELQGELKIAATNLEIAIAHYEAKLEEIDIEKDRIGEYCDAVVDYADIMLGRAEHQETLLKRRKKWETVKMGAKIAMDAAAHQVTVADCIVIVGLANGTNCPQKGIAFAAFWAVRIASLGVMAKASMNITSIQADMRSHDRDTAWLETVQDCTYAQIDSKARIATLSTQTEALTLEMAKAQYEVLQVQSRIEQTYNISRRLISQQDEASEMAIDVEAARNDPNVRIYKNDAVLSADRTFDAALEAAYKATKVYEYYTSQSYARSDQLYLVRMASHGDYNLETYLFELEDAYLAFEELYGTPDTRVSVISLKNNIFDVPRIDESYQPLSESQRTQRFRQMLTDPALRDGRGYIVIPFNTALRTLSPLTRNHKTLYIEA
ncbi:hypothetical protein KAI87_09205, partial [Myxococcota bacterium]|nr:hypothetical protein [Myxococcota bacterium]